MGVPVELAPTGERLVVENNGQIACEHLHRYAMAALVARDLDVLDIACGVGYGSNLLAQTAKTVVGIDIAADAIEFAHTNYKKNNLRFAAGDCISIPLPDGSVDVVVSFETIEHIKDHELFLCEIKRILRPTGFLLISSPDKKTYSDSTGHRNPFHIKELYHDEFRAALNSHFANVTLGKQKYGDGSIASFDNGAMPFLEITGDYQSIQETPLRESGVYSLALASDAPPPSLPPSFFSLNVGIRQSPAKVTVCQLFVTGDAAFQESQSLQQSITVGTPTTLTFENCENLDSRSRLKLRLDPSCCTGLISIREIVVKVRLKGSETEHVQTITPISSSRTMIHVDASAPAWLALDEDPQLYLSDLTIPEHAGWSVQVTLTISNSLESIAGAADLINALQKAREEETARLQQELSATQASAKSRLIEEQQKNTDLRKTLSELTEQLDRIKKLSQSDSAEYTKKLHRIRASHAAELANLERRHSQLQFFTEELKTKLANTNLAHEKATFLLNQELAAVRRSNELEVERERESHETTKRIFAYEISEKNAALKASALRVDALQQQLDITISQAATEMMEERARHDMTKQTLTNQIVDKDTALELRATQIGTLEHRLDEASLQSVIMEKERLRLASLLEDLDHRHQLVIESLLAQNEALHQFRERSKTASMQLKELRTQEVSLRTSLERTQQALAEIQNRPLVKLDTLLRKASIHMDDSRTNEHHHYPVI